MSDEKPSKSPQTAAAVSPIRAGQSARKTQFPSLTESPISISPNASSAAAASKPARTTRSSNMTVPAHPLAALKPSAGRKGRAKIDYSKCVSCGLCMVNCPFGAITDKSQIFQLVHASSKAAKKSTEPSHRRLSVSSVPWPHLKSSSKRSRVWASKTSLKSPSARISAPLRKPITMWKKVAGGDDKFLGTSLSVMVRHGQARFPDLAECISGELTPMVGTARIIKKEHPDAKIVFIGPCAAKKLEAMRRSVRSDVTSSLPSKNWMGMFAAKNAEFSDFKADGTVEQATTA